MIKSKYRKAVSFRHGATQQEVLTSPKWEDVDRREELLDYLSDHPDSEYDLFDENPLEFGDHLDAIRTTEGIICVSNCIYTCTGWNLPYVGFT